MLDLAEEIISLTNSKSEIKHLQLPSDDPKQRVPDITNASKQLGWQPVVDRKTGLKNTIAYFSNLKLKMETT
jgi:nucleoside-diphosphate-sugar epimerase